MVKRVPIINHEIFFVRISRSKPNLCVIIRGPNQIKVAILLKNSPERILKLGTFDAGTEKASKSLLKLPFSGSKIPMSTG